jgi:hypothetical protein
VLDPLREPPESTAAEAAEREVAFMARFEAMRRGELAAARSGAPLAVVVPGAEWPRSLPGWPGW